jgi:hypothetical protein
MTIDRHIDTLMSEAFHGAREPRSVAYKAGCRAKLAAVVRGERGGVTCPYLVGSAECDAFWAGVEEGSVIARQLEGRR